MLLSSLCITLGACRTSPADPSAITLTAEQNGTAVTIQVDDTLKIVLSGNPTTGFTWEVETVDAAILQQEGDVEYIPDTTEPEIVGSGGTFTFTFKAIAIGQTPLRLVYHRPWESGIPPAETFELSVTV